jgi:peroxiredoxin
VHGQRVNARVAFVVWVIAIAVLGFTAWKLLGASSHRVEIGSLAPDFRAVNVATGKTVTLRTEYRGTVTLVNIWGTWCGPCRQEMPAMDSLYRSLAARGFRIAAVSINEKSLDDVRVFVADHHVAFDVLNDSVDAISESYQATGAPESFLVDRTGHIVRIAQMAAPWNSAENHRIIEQLLAAPAS